MAVYLFTTEVQYSVYKLHLWYCDTNFTFLKISKLEINWLDILELLYTHTITGKLVIVKLKPSVTAASLFTSGDIPQAALSAVGRIVAHCSYDH